MTSQLIHTGFKVIVKSFRDNQGFYSTRLFSIMVLMIGMEAILSNPGLAQDRYQNLMRSAKFRQSIPNSSLAPSREIIYPRRSSTPIPAQSSSPTTRTIAASPTSYIVYVDSDSPLMLDEVRKVEPTAFRQLLQGRRVIQAGLFSDPVRAEKRLNELQAQGITAQIYSSDGSVLPNTGGESLPTPAPNQPSNENTTPATPAKPAGELLGAPPEVTTNPTAYFVIIPSNSSGLPTLAEQVVKLGVTPEAVQQREAPFGAHVAVGPFLERGLAERWTTYLRDYGLDARVYYGR